MTGVILDSNALVYALTMQDGFRVEERLTIRNPLGAFKIVGC